MEFSRHKYLSGVPFPTQGDLSSPETKTESLTSPALAGRFFTTNVTWEAHKKTIAKMKRKPSEWEKMSANETTNKELIFKIYTK